MNANTDNVVGTNLAAIVDLEVHLRQFVSHGAMAALLILSACADDPTADDAIITTTKGYEVGLHVHPLEAGTEVLATTTVHEAATSDPIVGATLGLTPWMPMHGHGIADDVAMTELGDGEYEARFTFSMPGSWELRLNIDGALGMDEATFDVEVQ